MINKKILSYAAQLIPIKIVADNTNPILLYHSVFNSVPKDMEGGLDNVNTNILYEQILNISKHFEIISVDNYLSLKNKKGYACITFDDGYKSVIENGFDVFKSLNIPVTIFINTCTLKNKIFWRDKVRFILSNNLVDEFEIFTNKIKKIKDVGFYRYTKVQSNNSIMVENEIDRFLTKKRIDIEVNNYGVNSDQDLIKHDLISYGNHSHNHYVMSSLSYEEQYQEIKYAKSILDNYDVNLSKVFSLPFGGNKDYNSDTVKALESLGYQSMLMSKNCLNFLNGCKTENNLIFLDRFMPMNEPIIKTIKKVFLKNLVIKH